MLISINAVRAPNIVTGEADRGLIGVTIDTLGHLGGRMPVKNKNICRTAANVDVGRSTSVQVIVMLEESVVRSHSLQFTVNLNIETAVSENLLGRFIPRSLIKLLNLFAHAIRVEVDNLYLVPVCTIEDNLVLYHPECLVTESLNS